MPAMTIRFVLTKPELLSHWHLFCSDMDRVTSCLPLLRHSLSALRV